MLGGPVTSAAAIDDLPLAASNLGESEPGFWLGPAGARVAYPGSGHEWCREIEDRSFWLRHRNRCIVALVEAFPAAGILLDVGGGNGAVSAALRAAGQPAVVLEPGNAGARAALARGLAPVLCSTLEGAGFPPSSLSAVGLFDVLEHLEQAESLRLLNGLLRPGGRVYVTVPAYRWLWSLDDDYAEHRDRYTSARLTQGLQDAGFVVDYCSYFFTLLPPFVLLLRVAPSRLRLKRSIEAKTTAREHLAGSGALARLAQRMLAFESRAIGQRRSLPFGASCLATARKT